MSEIMSLLPPNATPAEEALEAAVSRAFAIDVPLRKLWNPLLCPVEILPWLAWALSVDEWDPDWDEETMRTVIAMSFAVHKTKGTVGSVKRVLEAVGFPAAALVEWWEPTPVGAAALFHSGEPHTFSIGFDPQCNTAVFDEALYARLFRLLAHTTPVRSHICLYLDVHSTGANNHTMAVTPVLSHTEVLCIPTPPKTSAGVTHIHTASRAIVSHGALHTITTAPRESIAFQAINSGAIPVLAISITAEL